MGPIYDVAVIGASVAGATAALDLLQRGYSVVLVDKARFPRRKACGEGLSQMAIVELQKLNVDLDTLSIPMIPYFGFSFHENESSSTIRFDESESSRHGVGISRYYFDKLLIERVEAQGGRVVLGSSATVHSTEHGNIEFIIDGTRLVSKYLVIATGAYSKCPGAVGIPSAIGKGSRLAIRIDTNSSLPSFEGLLPIIVTPKFQVVCTPVAPHQVTLGVTTRMQDAANFRINSQHEIIACIEDTLGTTLTVMGEPLGAPAIGAVSRPAVFGSVFCIGDAFRQLDPIGGMGMTQAVLTARVTAQSIAELFAGNSKELVYRTHERRMTAMVRNLAAYTRLSYAALVHPLGRKTIGKLKTGPIAREIMRHQQLPMRSKTVWSLASDALIYVAGRV